MFSMLIMLLALTGNVYSANNSANHLNNIRTSFKGGIQRIVFDITGENEPAYYIKKDKNTLSLTLETSLSTDKDRILKKTLENTHYIGNVQFLHLPEEEELIITMDLKTNTSEEIMTLPHPSRVVVDISRNKTGV
ncbi:MAG: hypothetical protein NTY22_08000 [Proteobacteria bacterium]|nr:hypothetical protein [Pseudomonadota bacterium]